MRVVTNQRAKQTADPDGKTGAGHTILFDKKARFEVRVAGEAHLILREKDSPGILQ